MVPSVLYVVQNSLQYVAIEMLSAPVFQVMYQMKVCRREKISNLQVIKCWWLSLNPADPHHGVFQCGLAVQEAIAPTVGLRGDIDIGRSHGAALAAIGFSGREEG